MSFQNFDFQLRDTPYKVSKSLSWVSGIVGDIREVEETVIGCNPANSAQFSKHLSTWKKHKVWSLNGKIVQKIFESVRFLARTILFRQWSIELGLQSWRMLNTVLKKHSEGTKCKKFLTETKIKEIKSVFLQKIGLILRWNKCKTSFWKFRTIMSFIQGSKSFFSQWIFLYWLWFFDWDLHWRNHTRSYEELWIWLSG